MGQHNPFDEYDSSSDCASDVDNNSQIDLSHDNTGNTALDFQYDGPIHFYNLDDDEQEPAVANRMDVETQQVLVDFKSCFDPNDGKIQLFDKRDGTDDHSMATRSTAIIRMDDGDPNTEKNPTPTSIINNTTTTLPQSTTTPTGLVESIMEKMKLTQRTLGEAHAHHIAMKEEKELLCEDIRTQYQDNMTEGSPHDDIKLVEEQYDEYVTQLPVYKF